MNKIKFHAKSIFVILMILSSLITIESLVIGTSLFSTKDKGYIEQQGNWTWTNYSDWWRIGTSYTESNTSIPLYVGWNLIGWYHDYDTTASSLAGNISGCEMVSKFDAIQQTYKTYIADIGPASFDFVITQGMGLFIYVNVSSIWYGEG